MSSLLLPFFSLYTLFPSSRDFKNPFPFSPSDQTLLVSPRVFAQCRYPESNTELDLTHYLSTTTSPEKKKPLLLRMGSAPSTPRRGGAFSPEAAEYLIGTFVGDTPFPLSSEFWQKLLELPLNVQWSTQRVQQACELLG